ERRLPLQAQKAISATLVTSELPANIIQSFADRLNRIENVDVSICVVKNEFFGGGINIAGLLTGQDILSALERFPSKKTVYLPGIWLRDGYLFLDDFTLEDMQSESGLDLRIGGSSPTELAVAMGLIEEPRKRRVIPEHWMMEETSIT